MCSNRTFDVTVTDDEDGTFTYASAEYVYQATQPLRYQEQLVEHLVQLRATLTITGEIDLSASTAGTYTVSYLTSGNTCAVTGTADVTITDDEDGTFTYSSTEYCSPAQTQPQP